MFIPKKMLLSGLIFLLPLVSVASDFEPARVKSLPNISTGNAIDDNIRKLNQYISLGNEIANEFDQTIDIFKRAVVQLSDMNRDCPEVWTGGLALNSNLLNRSLELSHCSPDAIKSETAFMRTVANKLDKLEQEVVHIKKKVVVMSKAIIVLSNRQKLQGTLGELDAKRRKSARLRERANDLESGG